MERLGVGGNWCPVAAITKYDKTSGLNDRNASSRTPEAGSLRRRRPSGTLPLKAPGRDLFRESLLASGSFLACGSIIPAFTRHSPCVSVCAQISAFLKDTGHIGGNGWFDRKIHWGLCICFP